jgi:uncharacterized damage-inducible protein DinB
MSFLDSFLGELTHEAASTRALFERVPLSDGDWKPHPKSMTLARLAGHTAEIPGWIAPTVQLPELAFNMKDYKPTVHATTAELVAAFDKGIAEGTRALNGISEASLQEVWRLKVDGQVALELPRAQVLRAMVLNHLIHHRGQLTVYLRMKDVPLPSVYGPTADTM